MSTTRIEEKNKEEATNKPLVLDSGATSHYYPTAFDEESPNDGRSQGNRITLADGSEVLTRRSQGNSKIVIAEFKKKFNRLVSVGALVQQHEHPVDLLTRRVTINGRITQIYARHTTHVSPELPSPTQIRLSAAENVIQTVDISSNYLHLPIDPSIAELPVAVQQRIGQANYSRNYCHTHGQVSHNASQCRNETSPRQAW